jgi:hypothetical protein
VTSKRNTFVGKFFYQLLSTLVRPTCPWKSIWKVRAPSRVAFFVWTKALGKILTLDNLSNKNIIVLEWCHMCEYCGESIDHLFLSCEVATEMWNAHIQLLVLLRLCLVG